MNAEATANRPKTPFLDWFARHPVVGLAGTVTGIFISLLLFFLSQKERDIRYATSASPTTIVKNGQSSDLKVYFKDKELTSDVSSIQIAVWNMGRETVRRENMLSKTITLRFNPPTTILEARVKRVTRNLINFQIDRSDSSSGILHCSWDVLEHGDGALLEVFYIGASGEILSDGAIEGQRPIGRVMPDAFPVPNWGFYAIGATSLVIGLPFPIMIYRGNKSLPKSIVGWFTMSMFLFAVLLFFTLIVADLMPSSVPFAF
jgi:hypothetical protein